MKEALNHLKEATCPEDVFGALADETALSEAYRKLALLAHPDRGGDAGLFVKLGYWRDEARKRLAEGTYGQRRAPFDPVTLRVNGEVLTLTGVLAEGLMTTVYEAEYPAPTGFRAFVKIARSPADNDLLEREGSTLNALWRPDDDPIAEREFFAKQRVYVPRPLTRFAITDAERRQRAGLVLTVPAGRCFTGKELRERKFPRGIEAKQVWWIWRRLLLTLWLAHLRGYAHGAVTPDHLLIYPEQHGLVLLDWAASAKLGIEPVPLADPHWKALQPPELFTKAPAAVPSDLYQAASTALYLLGDEEKTVAEPIRRFIARCRDLKPGRRPQDAEHAHAVLGRLLGRREFAEFVVE
jgi:hypothetical protein